MPRVIVLDTGLVSNSAVHIGDETADLTPSQKCRQWLTECDRSGAIVFVPAIAYYEALREIERRRAYAQRERLKEYCFQEGRFVTLTTSHLEAAAVLWARSRNIGNPTSDSAALDGDSILCAQVQSLISSDTDYVVATTNTKHLTQFVNAQEWQNITL